MKARLGRNWLKQWYISLINNEQSESLYWGSGTLEDAVVSIPALLEEYPDLENASDWQKLYDEHTAIRPTSWMRSKKARSLIRSCRIKIKVPA
jgi:hypothetical protein